MVNLMYYINHLKMGSMKSKTRMKSLRLDVEVIKKIDKLAKRENRNFTNMVETILKSEAARLGI